VAVWPVGYELPPPVGIYAKFRPRVNLLYITRGIELYSELPGHDVFIRLAERQFPDSDSRDPIDNIIVGCWSTRFKRTPDLVHEVLRFAENTTGSESVQTVNLMSDQKFISKKELCKGFYHLLEGSCF
jgi:hypothetical protein